MTSSSRNNKCNRRRGRSSSDVSDHCSAATTNGQATSDCPPPRQREQSGGKQLTTAKQTENGVTSVIRNTDLGNARRLAQRHGKVVRYIHTWRQWVMWNGTHWERDETGAIYRLAHDTIESMYEEALRAGDVLRPELAGWAAKSESDRRIEAMIKQAQHLTELAADHSKFDQDPFLLNCLNGTLDLRTGELRQHMPQDLITKRVDVEFDATAQCPVWNKFLCRSMNKDEELIEFLRRAIGYSLTGSIKEQCLFFLYGSGRNGKSTFVETLFGLLGPYAQKTPADMLLAKAQGNNIPHDVARLVGVRCAVASEIEAGRRLDEAKVKDLTGGDTLVARFLHKNLFEFQPTHTLWIYGNHKPLIEGTDDGIWRRIHQIPFNVQIPEDEIDRDLLTKLKSEIPGILNWAVRGCLDWQRNGLCTPEIVKRANRIYRLEMDVLANFFSDCCQFDAAARSSARELYEAYEVWCVAANDSPMTKRDFGLRLTERGLETKRGTGGQRYWLGISVTASDRSDRSDAGLGKI